MIEYSTDHMTGEAMYHVIGEQVSKELTPKDSAIIENILETSKTFYPEQYAALDSEYKSCSLNKSRFNFVRARRIINCCFGENDRQPDIDEFGNYNFEMVKCPLIAECKWYKIICQPRFESSLSDREFEVMSYYFKRFKTETIAEKMFLSIHTVSNHRKHSLRKMKLHSLEEFIDYAHVNNLFK